MKSGVGGLKRDRNLHVRIKSEINKQVQYQIDGDTYKRQTTLDFVARLVDSEMFKEFIYV